MVASLFHEIIILFHKVRNHKFELRERDNTWRNRPLMEQTYIANWKTKSYFF